MLLCAADTAPWLFQLGTKWLPCYHSPHGRELLATVPGCGDGEIIPAPEQEAYQHFLLHRLQAASWGIIWENNSPFLPPMPGHAQ